MKKNKIVLVGYMGSGKSEVGSHLKEKLGFSFWDLDSYIEKKENVSIASLFSSRGELYFRTIERKCLIELLNDPNPMIISLGGGTPCYFDTMDILIQNENVLTIYLKTSIQELGNRLFPTRKNRPLIAHLHNEDELKEFVGKHLFERVPFYSKSDITISTDLLRPEEVALKLASKLT